MTSLSDWTPAKVKYAVETAGSNLSALARRFDLAPSTLRSALRRPQQRAETVIAQFLAVEARTIWPSRYDARGNRTVTRGFRSRHAPRSSRGERS